VFLPEDGYVAIHDSSLLDGVISGSVIGISEYLEGGTYRNLDVTLFDVAGADFDDDIALDEDQTLIAMPHMETNDNEVYNFVETGGEEDGPYTEDGEAVVDDGKVTVVEETEEVTDVDVLNFALTLEHLEAAYYSEFLDEYSEREVETSGPARVLTGDGNDRYTVYQKIQTVRDHEEAHVEALTQTIEDLGGEPVEPLNYEFPYDSIEAFVALSATIEAVGVSAYAGAAPLIENDDLIPPALSVHSVEARHTSYFNVLNTTSPFPNAFDPARSMDEVLEIASQFIVGMNSEGGDKRMFTVTVENVSKPGTVDTDRANGVVPLSPPAYGVYTGENPAFVPGEDANDGTELIAEDGFPGGPLPPESGGLADTLAESENVSDSGVASSPGGSIEAPALGPGESVDFSVMASAEEAFTMETMFVQSNDWFYGFEGLALYDGDEPIEGDVTDLPRIVRRRYQRGYCARYWPGSKARPGPDGDGRRPRRGRADPIQLAEERHSDFDIPGAEDVIAVTVTPK